MLAPNSPWRPAVTARAGVAIETEAPAPSHGPSAVTTQEAPTANPALYLWAMHLWAMLLARIYEIFRLSCDHCGGEIRVIAFVSEAVPIREVLEHIGEPTKPPRIHPPRAPPEGSDDPRTVDLEELSQDCFEYQFDQTVSW